MMLIKDAKARFEAEADPELVKVTRQLWEDEKAEWVYDPIVDDVVGFCKLDKYGNVTRNAYVVVYADDWEVSNELMDLIV